MNVAVQQKAAAAANGSNNNTSNKSTNTKQQQQHHFPLESNDILEVLCSGEPTAGKLLMHFFLFYGQIFDSAQSCIEVRCVPPHASCILPRQGAGGGAAYDGAGLLWIASNDPLVVYDPLGDGGSTSTAGAAAENVKNNVARSCFAWSNIRWVFAQSYTTLTHTTLDSASSSPSSPPSNKAAAGVERGSGSGKGVHPRGSTHAPVGAPLLELIMSY